MGILEFLSRQSVSNTLIIAGFITLILSALSKKVNLSLIISSLCFLLFLAGAIYSGGISLQHFGLFFLGGVFLFFEILIPGFGVFGIGGIIAMGLGISIPSSSLEIKLISFSLAVILTTLIAIYMIKKGTINKNLSKLVLDDQIYEKSKDLSSLTNKSGKSLSNLRPSGIIEIDGKKYDALTDGEFIEKNQVIKVIRTEGKKIIVEKSSN